MSLNRKVFCFVAVLMVCVLFSPVASMGAVTSRVRVDAVGQISGVVDYSAIYMSSLDGQWSGSQMFWISNSVMDGNKALAIALTAISTEKYAYVTLGSATAGSVVSSIFLFQ